MARSFLSFSLTLAVSALMFLSVAATPATAQPLPPEVPSPTPKPKQYPELQEIFNKLLQNRDIKTAIRSLEAVCRTYPELPSPYILMYNFLSLKQVNQPNAARFQLEEAVKKTPSDPEPWVMLGNIALQDRRIAEGTNDYAKAKSLLVNYPNKDRKNAIETQMLSGEAQVAEYGEEWAEAEARMHELLKLAPEDLVAYQRLARALFWQTKAGEAYKVLKQARDIDKANAKKNHTRQVFPTPEAIMAQYYEAFEKTDNPEHPMTWFKAAVTADPENLATRQVVAIWALQKGNIPMVKEQAEAALRIEAADAAKPINERLYPGSNVGRMLRGLVALWEKDWVEAENYFQKVILESPNDFGARNNLALALVEQDDQQKKQRALAYAEANYRENNNSPDALSTLGWVYFRRNEFDQAGLALEQALKATNGQLNNADTATYVAHILYHQDRKYQAKQILEGILGAKSRPFSMKPEAQRLYEKVKDAVAPAAAKTP